MIQRRPNGFTLLELMIAAALAALIVTVVYGAYRATLDGSRRCRTYLTLYHEAVTLCDHLKSQLQASQPIVNPAAPAQTGLMLSRTGGGGTALRFVTSRPLLANNTGAALYLVNWQTSPDGRMLYCERPFILLDQFKSDPAPYDYVPISQTAVQLNLELLDEHGIMLPADAGQAASPHAIQIDLTVLEPEPIETSFTIHTLALIIASAPPAGQSASAMGDRQP